MRQATRQNSLGAPYVATDTVCTLPDHRCHDKRRWQRVTSSEATLLVRPQALLRWHTATLLFRRVFWALPYPLLSAFHRPYKPNHPSIGLFRTPKWATHRVEAGQPMAWQLCLFPGLQRGVDTPVRTRAYRGRRLRVDGPAARGVRQM